MVEVDSKEGWSQGSTLKVVELDLQDFEDSFNTGFTLSKIGLSVRLSVWIMVSGWHRLYFSKMLVVLKVEHGSRCRDDETLG